MSPAIEQIAADAEFFGDLGNRLASAQKFNGLRLELGGGPLAVDWKPWQKKQWVMAPTGSAEFVAAMEDVVEV